METPNRREAVKATAAVMVGLAAARGATLAAPPPQDNVKDKGLDSGPTAVQPRGGVLELNAGTITHRTLAGGLQSFFTRISPDASPGRNTLTINGLPAGTRAISVWMTEWASGNQPHAGGAFFNTASVQLYDNGQRCRVVFNLEWSSHLPAACQVIYGPG